MAVDTNTAMRLLELSIEFRDAKEWESSWKELGGSQTTRPSEAVAQEYADILNAAMPPSPGSV